MIYSRIESTTEEALFLILTENVLILLEIVKLITTQLRAWSETGLKII